MSGYIPEIRFETSYEDDDVVITLAPLTRAAFISVMPILQKAEADRDDMQVYDAACEVLNTHIVSIEGLRNKNGDAISKDDLLDKVYFVQLVTEVFSELISQSSLGKDKKIG